MYKLIFILILIFMNISNSSSIISKKFDITALINVLERSDTIEAAITLIPQEDVRFFSLVFATRSTRQFASPALPRVIMANDSLLLAFTGNDKVQGGNSVEAIQFNRSTGTFDFYNLEMVGAELKVMKNPASCFSCHAGRPIWDTYPFWPGFYGSSLKPIPLAENEIENLKNFIGKDLPQRYNSLDLRQTVEETYDLLERNNSSIGHKWSNNNFEAIVSQLSKNPRFDEFKIPLAASLFEEVSSDDLFELIITDNHATNTVEDLRRVFAETLTEVEAQFHRYVNTRAETHSMLSGLSIGQIFESKINNMVVAAVDLKYIKNFAKFIFVTKLMGFDVNTKWSMVFGKEMLGFSNGGINLKYLSKRLFEVLIKTSNLEKEMARQRIFEFNSQLRSFPPGTDQNSDIKSLDKTEPIQLKHFLSLKEALLRKTCSGLLTER
jgi:hypothetical protein